MKTSAKYFHPLVGP